MQVDSTTQIRSASIPGARDQGTPAFRGPEQAETRAAFSALLASAQVQAGTVAAPTAQTPATARSQPTAGPVAQTEAPPATSPATAAPSRPTFVDQVVAYAAANPDNVKVDSPGLVQIRIDEAWVTVDGDGHVVNANGAQIPENWTSPMVSMEGGAPMLTGNPGLAAFLAYARLHPTVTDQPVTLRAHWEVKDGQWAFLDGPPAAATA